MTENTFKVEIGGQTWLIPRMPWKVVKHVQPKLIHMAQKLAEGDDAGIFGRLDETALDEQLKCLSTALLVVDPTATVAKLEEIHFKVDELVAANLQVLRACGLELSGAPPAEAAPVT